MDKLTASFTVAYVLLNVSVKFSNEHFIFTTNKVLINNYLDLSIENY